MKLIESGPDRVVARERLSSYLFGFPVGILLIAVSLVPLRELLPNLFGPAPLVGKLIAGVFGGGFLLVGLVICWKNVRTTIVAEKATGLVRVQSHRFFIPVGEKAVPTTGLKAVRVTEKISKSGSGSNVRSRAISFLDLVFDGREEHLFNTDDEHRFNPLGLFGKTEFQELADLGNALAQLLNVPYEEKRAPSMVEVLQDVGGAMLGDESAVRRLMDR